jgi:hypothetical protein
MLLDHHLGVFEQRGAIAAFGRDLGAPTPPPRIVPAREPPLWARRNTGAGRDSKMTMQDDNAPLTGVQRPRILRVVRLKFLSLGNRVGLESLVFSR